MAGHPKADELFRPIGAIQGEHSRLFAGRSDVVKTILGSLELSGQIPVIYGERGVGKTSVAWRTFEILQSKDINDEAREIASSFDLDDNYIPLWVECGDWFAGIESALLALLIPRGLRQAVTIADLFPDLMSEESKLKAKASFEFNLALFKANMELSGSDKGSAITKAYEESLVHAFSSPIELFSQVCGKLVETYPNSTVVIFIDEFDRLPDKALVGSILKTLTSVRFVIIGVAKTAKELIGSHESVARKLDEILVPPFQLDETQQVFDNAVAVASEIPGAKQLWFSPEFVHRVFHDTGGYPNLVQKIGYHVIRADGLNRKLMLEDVRIGVSQYVGALRDMFRNTRGKTETSGEIEATISSAVSDSTRRLAILQALTEFGSRPVGIGELVSHLEGNNRIQLHANLDRLVDDGVLKKSGDADNISFASPIHLMAARLFLFSRHSN